MQTSVSSPIQPEGRCRGPALAAIAGLLLLASHACCQLPAAPASGVPPAQPTQMQSPAPLQPIAAQPNRARVQFTGDQLTVAALDSSLNAILSDISKLTGMKITGGVAEERVYGNYGPDSAQAVLDELLDGTGTNMLLRETPQHTLAELILTPRNGGPTPPSPYGSRDAGDEENLPPGLAGRRRDFTPSGRRYQPAVDMRQFDPSQIAQQQQPAQQQALPQQPTSQPNGDAPAQPDPNQPSPNGVKTPQQVMFQNFTNQPTPTAPPQ